MSQPAGQSALARLSEMPLVRIAAYYVLLISGTMLLTRLFPDQLSHLFTAERMDDLARVPKHGDLTALAQPMEGSAGQGGGAVPLAPALAAGLAMVGSTLLMVPVAWIYTMTRQKKGYQQSTVQTLVILPAVVAGVVILVKNSLALAFSLAGIVAAMNFRARLRDSKDMVYVFLAMVIGLAAGVQIITVALAVSMIFNLIILILAWSDFGRSPAALEGARARARLERARQLAAVNRTGMFMSVMEREVLRSLSPEQLDVLSERARRLKARGEGGVEPGNERPLDTVLRLYGPDPDALRAPTEAVLTTQVKAWRYSGVVAGDNGVRGLEYRLRLRRKVPAATLTSQLRDRLGPSAERVELT
ncbi:MAG: DUF4956 domain-containing protein [Deltaproteobacteria bacterium]